MWQDEKGQRLNDVAMQESATSAERVGNFRAYHEYVLGEHLFVAIYQPTQNVAYDASSVTLPGEVRGTRFRAQTVLDIKPIE